MTFIGIIPARYASTRFPGKPLADINGKTMIERVYLQSKKVFENVYVATDDKRIEQEVKRFNGKVVITSSEHKSGTDRCAEAIEKIIKLENKKFDIIINIQGDEPFIQAEQLNKLKLCFSDTTTQIATLIKKIDNIEDVFNPNKPKVIYNQNFEAIYFSRSPIPFIRNANNNEWLKNCTFYKHIGLYAYRYDILKEITKLEQSSLEKAESLEQLRWLQNGYKIKITKTDFESISIDTPEDLEKAIKY